MKKMICIIAAITMMTMLSCSKNGQQAWNEFKELSAKFETKEAFEASFESELDGFAAAFEWKMAVEDMGNHMDELTPEQVDSFKMIIANVQQTIDELEADENAAVEVESEDSVETEEAIESDE